jgi:hypothetical protein
MACRTAILCFLVAVLPLGCSQVVTLPAPYFNDLRSSDQQQADCLAEQFAEALGVTIVKRTEYVPVD